MGDVQAFARRRPDDEFRLYFGALIRTGAFDPRSRTFWADALLHLQPDGRNRNSNAAGKTSLEEGSQYCFDCQSMQLRAACRREFYELGRLLGTISMNLRSVRKLTVLLAPIILLTACSDGPVETSETQWQKAYDAGLAAQEAGDLSTAEKKLRESIAALGDEKPSQKRATSTLRLASILLDEHDCAAAATSAQEAMVFFESKWNPLKSSSSLDESGPNFLNSMLTLARALNCQRRYSEALPLLERIRSLQSNVIVPLKFHHELTDALRVALVATGNKQEASQLHEEIRSTESTLKESDLDEINRLSFLDALKEGKSAHQGGNFRSAEKLLKHAVEMAKADGNDSLEMAEAMLNLGDVYSSQAKYTDAKPLLEKALTMARKHLAKNDRRLKDYLKRLASFYANNSQWKMAAALDEEALALVFPEEYKQNKRVHRSRDLMDALIEIYKKDGQLDKAEKIARRKLDLELAGYGTDSRKVGVTSCQLAQILILRKNDKEAAKYFEQSFSVLKSNKKADPREIEKTVEEFGKFLDRKGDKTRAQKLRDDMKAMNDELLDGLAGKDR